MGGKLPLAVVHLWLLLGVPLLVGVLPMIEGHAGAKSRKSKSASQSKSSSERGSKKKQRYFAVLKPFQGVTAQAMLRDQRLVEMESKGGEKVGMGPIKTLASFVGDADTAAEVAKISGVEVFEDKPRYPDQACPQSCSCGAVATLFNKQEVVGYGLGSIQSNDAVFLNLTNGPAAPGVSVCIIDYGIDPAHPDLAGNNITGQPFLQGISFDWNNPAGAYHSTHIAGIVAAIRNGKGVVGAIYGGTNIYVVNIFGNLEQSQSWNTVWAWDSCYKHLLDKQRGDPQHKLVVLMSFSGPEATYPERAMLQYLNKTGDILFVASVGNSNINPPGLYYPASYDEVISVTAVDCKNETASFANYNDKVELAAPGVGVLSTTPLGSNETAGQPYLRISAKSLRPAPCLYARASVDNIPARSPVTGLLVDCGIGSRPCRAAKGQICIIDVPDSNNMSPSACNRVQRCAAFGATAAILISSDCDFSYYGVDCTSEIDCPCSRTRIIPSIGLTPSDGLLLRRYLRVNPGSRATLGWNPFYRVLDGTSMAAPYAAGVAAKLWSRFRKCNGADIRQALAVTARDLGAPGKDPFFGYGLVQARTAAEWLSQQPCGML